MWRGLAAFCTSTKDETIGFPSSVPYANQPFSRPSHNSSTHVMCISATLSSIPLAEIHRTPIHNVIMRVLVMMLLWRSVVLELVASIPLFSIPSFRDFPWWCNHPIVQYLAILLQNISQFQWDLFSLLGLFKHDFDHRYSVDCHITKIRLRYVSAEFRGRLGRWFTNHASRLSAQSQDWRYQACSPDVWAGHLHERKPYRRPHSCSFISFSRQLQ